MDQGVRDRIISQFLKHFPANREAAQAFAETSQLQSCKKGDIVKRAGTREEWIYLIVSGSAGIFIPGTDKTICLDLCLEGDFLTEYESLITGEITSCFTQCLEPCTLAKIPVSTIQCDQTGRLRGILDSATQAMFVDRQNRLISLLTQTPMERFSQLRRDHPELMAKVSVTVLASWLGISREHLSRLRAR